REGHKSIQKASAMVIGAGGLAHVVLPYLAAAGVSKILIVEGDKVEESNLHRQILFTKNDIGSPKLEVTQRYLRSQFPDTHVEVFSGFLGKNLGIHQIPPCDLIIDCSDNFSAALSAEEYALLHQIPMVYGKASRWDGQVTILNGVQKMRLASVFRGIDTSASSFPCSAVGVMAPVVGAVGCIMATDALKILGGMTSELEGKLWTFDFLTCRSMLVDISEAASHSQKENEQAQARLNLQPEQTLLVDVREEFERNEALTDALKMPFSEISENLHKLPTDRNLVFFCESGERARQAMAMARFHGMMHVAAINMREIAAVKMSPLAVDEKM
ncbi:MAG: ThiF family adenylyltransferase, partial [Flavobacteriales bacterium]